MDNESGIAIQSTYHLLDKSFDNNTEDIVYIGTIRYADYKTEGSMLNQGFSPLLMKRKSFECPKVLPARRLDPRGARTFMDMELQCGNWINTVITMN